MDVLPAWRAMSILYASTRAFPLHTPEKCRILASLDAAGPFPTRYSQPLSGGYGSSPALLVHCWSGPPSGPSLDRACLVQLGRVEVRSIGRRRKDGPAATWTSKARRWARSDHAN